MDSRLPYYLGRRLTLLRKSDVPPVALAIVGHVEGFCEAQRLTVHETPVIRIWGSGVDVVVRGEDWEKIIPYLRDGTFNPIAVPVPKSVPLHPVLDLSLLDARQQAFYARVLGVLQTLFPDDYPTSNL